MALVKRSPAMIILFSILSCGIYYIFWYISTTNEIEASLRDKDGSVSSGGMAFLFGILSCGIYTIYWYYKQGQRLAKLGSENNVNINDNSTIYLILSILGFGIIADVLMQSDINKIIDTGSAS